MGNWIEVFRDFDIYKYSDSGRAVEVRTKTAGGLPAVLRLEDVFYHPEIDVPVWRVDFQDGTSEYLDEFDGLRFL